MLCKLAFLIHALSLSLNTFYRQRKGHTSSLCMHFWFLFRDFRCLTIPKERFLVESQESNRFYRLKAGLEKGTPRLGRHFSLLSVSGVSARVHPGVSEGGETPGLEVLQILWVLETYRVILRNYNIFQKWCKILNFKVNFYGIFLLVRKGSRD